MNVGDFFHLMFCRQPWGKRTHGKLRRLMLVIRHARAMWRQLSLPKNASKGGWNEIPLWDLLDLARREMDELISATWDFEHGNCTAERIAEEAADLSNFAAMVADNARHKEV